MSFSDIIYFCVPDNKCEVSFEPGSKLQYQVFSVLLSKQWDSTQVLMVCWVSSKRHCECLLFSGRCWRTYNYPLIVVPCCICSCGSHCSYKKQYFNLVKKRKKERQKMMEEAERVQQAIRLTSVHCEEQSETILPWSWLGGRIWLEKLWFHFGIEILSLKKYMITLPWDQSSS